MTQPARAIRDALDRALLRLRTAEAKTELLAELGERRRVFGLIREPVLRERGRVWRLGVFLLASDGALYATGEITRVAETGRPTYQSVGAEQRRRNRALAMRSGLPKGETVNFAATPIAIEEAALREGAGPLFLRGEEPFVRWRHSLGGEMTMALDAYLRDRVELLAHPTEGA